MDQRPGPRPMALHLTAAAATSLISRAAWPMLKSGLLPWSRALAADAESLRQSLASVNPEAFDRAVDREARRRFDAFLSGIEAYRAHPYRRAMDDPPSVWRDGTTVLRDYGHTHPAAAAAPPILVVPSLINRAYILDLDHESSLLRHLAADGWRPLLVDWAAPGAGERRFTLSDYIAGRLGAALDAATDLAGGPVPVIGYCMGGTLAVALAHGRPESVAGLALLATPWDFHAATGGPPPGVAAMQGVLAALIDGLGALPVDFLQALFFGLDPMQGWVKFRRFAATAGDPDAARAFVALEDWANDGVPLAGPVARECLTGWYLENTPARGAWRVAGVAVRPAELRCPSLVVVPAQDRIVPPASALALADAIPGAERLTPPAGHIGMIVGSRAETALWQPLAAWLGRITGRG